MNRAWKCATCWHANARLTDVCHWCGGTEKLVIEAVRGVNQMQNTPSEADLLRVIAHDEANRQTEVSQQEQIAELIRQYFDELDKHPPAGIRAEKGTPCQSLSKRTRTPPLLKT